MTFCSVRGLGIAPGDDGGDPFSGGPGKEHSPAHHAAQEVHSGSAGAASSLEALAAAATAVTLAVAKRRASIQVGRRSHAGTSSVEESLGQKVPLVPRFPGSVPAATRDCIDLATWH